MFLSSDLASSLTSKFNSANTTILREAAPTDVYPSPLPPDEELTEEFFRDLSHPRRLILASRYGWLTRPNWGDVVTTDGIASFLSCLTTNAGVNESMRHFPWYRMRDSSGNGLTQRNSFGDSRTPFNFIAAAVAEVVHRHNVSPMHIESYLSSILMQTDISVQTTLDLLCYATRREPYTFCNTGRLCSMASGSRMALVLTSVPEFSSQSAVEDMFGSSAANLPRGLTLSESDVGKVFFWVGHTAFRFSPPNQDTGNHCLRVAHPITCGNGNSVDPVINPSAYQPAIVSYSPLALPTSMRYWRFASTSEIALALAQPGIINAWYYLPQTSGSSSEDFIHSLGISSQWNTAQRVGLGMRPIPATTAASTTTPPPLPERADPSPTIRSDVTPYTPTPPSSSFADLLEAGSQSRPARRATVRPVTPRETSVVEPAIPDVRAGLSNSSTFLYNTTANQVFHTPTR